MKEFLTIKAISAVVCDALNLKMFILFSKSRNQIYVFARYLIIEMSIAYLGVTVNELMAEFGFKDHTSIMHARKQHSGLTESRNAYYMHLTALVDIHLSHYIKLISSHDNDQV